MPELRLVHRGDAYRGWLVLKTPSRQALRRQRQHYPLRNRWLIVKVRQRVTWREWWQDLIYLLHG